MYFQRIAVTEKINIIFKIQQNVEIIITEVSLEIIHIIIADFAGYECRKFYFYSDLYKRQNNNNVLKSSNLI